MSFDECLCGVFGTCEAVEFVLRDTEGLNEFDTTVRRVDRFERRVAQKRESDYICVVIRADGAIRGNPMVRLKPLLRFKDVPRNVLKKVADPHGLFCGR